MLTKRIDYMDAALSAPVEGPGGSLLVEGIAARPGIYVYRNADGSERRELVPRDALWHRDSIATLARAPVTYEHPTDFVTPENVRMLQHGDVDGEIIEAKNGFVRLRMALRSREIQDAVRSGKVQLSPGYEAEILETPGVDPEFGRFDAIQISRNYNHLAVVDRARGGDSMKIRTDALTGEPEVEPKKDEAEVEKEDAIKVIPDRSAMGTGLTYELFEEAIIGLKAQIAEILAPVVDMLGKLDQQALAAAASKASVPGEAPEAPPQATGAKDQENPEETAVEEDPEAAEEEMPEEEMAEEEAAPVPPKKKPVADAAEVREDAETRKRVDDLARDLQIGYDPGISAGDLARLVISKVRPDLTLKSDAEYIGAALAVQKPATFEKPRGDAKPDSGTIPTIYGPKA